MLIQVRKYHEIKKFSHFQGRFSHFKIRFLWPWSCYLTYNGKEPSLYQYLHVYKVLWTFLRKIGNTREKTLNFAVFTNFHSSRGDKLGPDNVIWLTMKRINASINIYMLTKFYENFLENVETLEEKQHEICSFHQFSHFKGEITQASIMRLNS